MQNNIPQKRILKREATVLVSSTKEEAFDYISSSEKLPEWLKKVGMIPGAKHVEELDDSYDKIGQQRKVIFEGGSSAVEQLLTRNFPMNYSYKINQFSNFLKNMSDAAYGELFFDTVDAQTRITWVYSFTYKNVLARMFLSLFLSVSYKKFMAISLRNAKGELEK
ncbi:MAG: SRPBCC family protein [Bacteroidota bacterium]